MTVSWFSCFREFRVFCGREIYRGLSGAAAIRRSSPGSSQFTRQRSAGIDHHVAGASVEMTDHRLPARGTVEQPVARILPARRHAPRRAPFTGAHHLDDGGKAVHVDQHAETACATEQWMTLQPAVREGRGTGRARQRCLAQQLQVFNQRRRIPLTAAVVAQEKPPVTVDPHRCPAVVAMCHHGIIAERARVAQAGWRYNAGRHSCPGQIGLSPVSASPSSPWRRFCQGSACSTTRRRA